MTDRFTVARLPYPDETDRMQYVVTDTTIGGGGIAASVVRTFDQDRSAAASFAEIANAVAAVEPFLNRSNEDIYRDAPGIYEQLQRNAAAALAYAQKRDELETAREKLPSPDNYVLIHAERKRCMALVRATIPYMDSRFGLRARIMINKLLADIENGTPAPPPGGEDA